MEPRITNVVAIPKEQPNEQANQINESDQLGASLRNIIRGEVIKLLPELMNVALTHSNVSPETKKFQRNLDTHISNQVDETLDNNLDQKIKDMVGDALENCSIGGSENLYIDTGNL
tara:strand:- start:327 stop:674 length:348 start_codon:yes stop_codon:yes gene_type:complete